MENSAKLNEIESSVATDANADAAKSNAATPADSVQNKANANSILKKMKQLVSASKLIEAGRLIPTEVPVLGVASGIAAYVACGNDGNNIKPNTNTKAQQLTAPDNPSHDIQLSLIWLNLVPCILSTATSYFLMLRCPDKKRHRRVSSLFSLEQCPYGLCGTV